ncbi:MAG: hypothetical protein ACSHX3_14815 [Litorimonas sp.]
MRHLLTVLFLALPTIGFASALIPSCRSSDLLWRAEVQTGTLTIYADPAATVAHTRRLDGRDHAVSQTAALIYHAGQNAFLVALADAPELWLVDLDADAGPYYDGFVHSYIAGMEESLASEEGRFSRLRIDLDTPLTALVPAADDPRAVDGLRADGSCVRVHLIAKREIGPCPDGAFK